MMSHSDIFTYYHNYTSLSVKYEQDVQKYLTFHKEHYLKSQIAARIAHLALVPFSHFTSFLDSLLGLGVGIVAIATLGRHKKIYVQSMDSLQGFNTLLSLPFLNLLRTVQPHAEIYAPNTLLKTESNSVTFRIRNSIRNLARDCYNAEHVFQTQVASRLTYALYTLTCVVTRVADAIIGVLAAPCALITGGKYLWVNTYAYQGLHAPGIIKDLFYCVIKLISPRAGVDTLLED